MNHPYATLGYGIEGDSVSVCYLNGHEPSCEEVGRNGALTPSRLDLIGNEGDRHHAEYMTNADVVIHETQYTEKYPARRIGATVPYAYLVQLAAVAELRRLVLTHHDPSHDVPFSPISSSALSISSSGLAPAWKFDAPTRASTSWSSAPRS